MCLRVLKMLRDISTIVDLAPYEFLLNANTRLPSTEFQDYLGLDLPEGSNGYFSSYALKTLVLYEWSRYPEKKYWSGSCMSDRVSQILDQLLLCVKHGGMRSFFYSDYNVLPGDFDEEMSGGQATINSITILRHWMTSKRNDTDYNFNDCLQSVTEDSRLASHKITFTNLSCLTLGITFWRELELVISKATGIEPLDRNKTRQRNGPSLTNRKHLWLSFTTNQICFCEIYIQALVKKVASKEKLILLNPTKCSVANEGFTRALDLFKEVAVTRMNSLGDNLPNYNIWTKEFKPGDKEIANFVKFLTDIFRKDLQILLSKL